MNDAPRVTVPVDDWKHVIGALKNAQARLGPGAAVCNVSAALAKVEHLSAAPTPEGGAVSDAIRAKYDQVKGTAYRAGTPAERMKDGRLQGLNDALAIAMVAEERATLAPAEAGEWITGDQLHEIMQSFTDRADVSEIASKINAAIALRAQPPAREDAQPLGCFCDEADCPSCSSINPAPDAVRVAVEALERIATVDMGGGFLGAQACRQVATKALSDMKANQKGGA